MDLDDRQAAAVDGDAVAHRDVRDVAHADGDGNAGVTQTRCTAGGFPVRIGHRRNHACHDGDDHRFGAGTL